MSGKVKTRNRPSRDNRPVFMCDPSWLDEVMAELLPQLEVAARQWIERGVVLR